MTHTVQLLVAFPCFAQFQMYFLKLFEMSMALLQLKQNTKYTESSFKRQSIKTLGLEKPRAVLHLNVLFLLQESNSEQLAFTGLKRTETDSFK